MARTDGSALRRGAWTAAEAARGARARAGLVLRPRSVAAVRAAVARRFLRGHGIEIGALHNPLRVPRRATVRYVDRLDVDALRRHYPELASERLVDVDVIDDGERLAAFGDATEDFVIANHFLEHCEDPVGALESMCRVVRPGGVVYVAVPDKRYTFDRDRPVTPVEHLFADHEHGPSRSRRGHFEEWARLVDRVSGDEEVERHVESLMRRGYSIHFHVWTERAFLELLVAVRARLGLAFDVALFARNDHENIAVLERAA